MKNLLIITFILASFCKLNAQSYVGYNFDNYAGVQSLATNPANIVDSRFKTDINLVSASLLVENDYLSTSPENIFDSSVDFNKNSKKTPTSNNNFYSNVDFFLPSFMMNIAPKHAIALSIRARGFSNLSNINGESYEAYKDNFDTSNSFTRPAESFNLTVSTWFEFGLTYAAVLIDNNKNFLKGGFTAKYLKGNLNTFGNTDNLSTIYTKNSAIDNNLNTIKTTGTITYGSNDGIVNNNNFDNGTGASADFGLIYEYRPNFEASKGQKNKNKYLYKIGLAVTDIGSIDFKNAFVKSYDLNRTVTEADYDNNSTQNLLNNLYTKIADNPNSTYNLPTALHLNLDWNMHNKFYLNLNADQKLTKTNAVNTNTIANNYSLTPRFESKWFTFSLPLNFMEYSGFQAGAGFRFGPIFVGSGSIITNLINYSKGADIYGGVKIPIYQGKIKDKDQDGVPDNEDDCRTEAGPIENKGCPYKNTDRDGTLDKDDKCIDVAGPKENNGCPYFDTDKDEVLDKDDKCVNEAGPKENNGCPYLDTDKDGVLDKDDKCPTVFGTKSNNGCPEVKVAEPKKVVEPVKVQDEVIKKINEFSKTILFDTGKATIKPESFLSLDAIVSVLNEYQNANFKIEGYTDNAGVPSKNLMLSKNRAAAVKQYLIDKGIRNDRLTSEGFGSTKPIASNNTPKGKNANRRVEINLVK